MVSNYKMTKKQDLLKLLNNILETKSYKEIAEELNIAIGTVKRWSELKNVPKSYCFELMLVPSRRKNAQK